ncbi:C1 family peptidase [Spirochaeta isovalerica]|uniref:Peptidase C1A papain C-terminal domain-containing protein n=1 Tax=Spirochaeta isovalerica TaxID=150 RepID=A0A841RI35_9SPIO|nr:C1 family peptidase [Spirochaeta isovalerica]MBB6482419.1 hypothetical protein [Spirochaeta isovalerica]
MNKLTKSFLEEISKFKDTKWIAELNLFDGSFMDDLSRMAGFLPDPGKLSLEERLERGLRNWLDHKEKIDTPTGREREPKPYPSSFSWLDAGGASYVTSVKNQKFCNSCVAFGTLAVVESMARLELKKPVCPGGTKCPPELSEAQLFFKSPGEHNCLTGWNLSGALSYLQETGVIPESDFPYEHDCDDKPLPSGWRKKRTVISGDVTLETHYDMKNWIAHKGPLISAVQLHPGLFFYKSGVYHPLTDFSLGGHCVAVVGYDDEEEAWLCKNSWGPHWGEKGYFRIAYGHCGIDSQMIGIEGFKTIYTV